MAIGIPPIVIDQAAPAHAQHMTTDINDAFNRVVSASQASDAAISDVVDDVTTLTSTVTALTPGLAKAWAVFSGTTGTILASHNVTSVTRTGTGAYDVVLATDFSSANYVAIPTVHYTAALVISQVLDGSKTAGGFQMVVRTPALVSTDPTEAGFVAFGDQ